MCRLDSIVKQTWYVDDSAAASSLEKLRRWWDTLSEIGPLYTYFPNDAKTHILVIAQHVNMVLKDTALTVSEEGKRYLGAMGTASFAICAEESGRMGKRSCKGQYVCSDTTSCTLCSIHPRPGVKMELPSTSS